MVVLAVIALVGVFAAIGYRRGATKTVAILLGLLLATVLAPPFGRAMEGLVRTFSGTGGVLNRLLSIGLAGALVAGAGSYLCSLGVKKLAGVWLRDEERWRRGDRLIGLGLGGVEGLLLVLVGMWAVLALEPVAASRLASDAAAGDRPHAVATRLRGAADALRSSALGSMARATMPDAGTDLMGLAADFAAISRDREALEFFTSTPVMKRIAGMPSVAAARAAIENDPELKGVFSEKGIDAQGIRRILESDTLLEVLDRTSIASDFRPLVGDLKAAIAEAKGRIKTTGKAPETRR